MTIEEKLRVMKRGFEAAMRWPYDRDIPDHVKHPEIAEKAGLNFDLRYLADIREMHEAYLLTLEK
jgi:hypothetical protein